MLKNKRKKILVLADWYEPGFKAGGPIRSCVNFVHYMKDGYELFLLTADRDMGDNQPYEGIETDKWLDKDGVAVFYASPGTLGWKNILGLIQEVNADFIYLNSMFSRYFSVYPLLMKRLGKINGQVVLAPRGMLKRSALHFKPAKKKLFLQLFKALQVPAHITFHATDTTEVKDIRLHFGDKAAVTLISNFPGFQKPLAPPPAKEPGMVKMIFVGRAHPIKNLHFLLESLRPLTQRIMLTIVAAIEDAGYWKSCSEIIASFPANISVQLMSDVPHHKLENILQQHHIFCLPTTGENFGHAIFEALSAGRPVLISDQTPWRNLEAQRAGWDLPLNHPAAFTAVIARAAAMEQDELLCWCKAAWQFSHDFICQSDVKQTYLKLFN